MNKLPNIILEGCDCVGKTSIMKELVRLLPYHTPMRMGYPEDVDIAMHENQLQVNSLYEGSKLYDRSMISECVYGPLFRNEYPEYVRQLEREAQIDVSTILVLVHAPVRTVESRFDGEVISTQQIPMILDTYQTEWRLSNFHHKLAYDSGALDSLDIAERIVKQYKAIEKEFNAKQR